MLQQQSGRTVLLPKSTVRGVLCPPRMDHLSFPATQMQRHPDGGLSIQPDRPSNLQGAPGLLTSPPAARQEVPCRALQSWRGDHIHSRPVPPQRVCICCPQAFVELVPYLPSGHPKRPFLVLIMPVLIMPTPTYLLAGPCFTCLPPLSSILYVILIDWQAYFGSPPEECKDPESRELHLSLHVYYPQCLPWCLVGAS